MATMGKPGHFEDIPVFVDRRYQSSRRRAFRRKILAALTLLKSVSLSSESHLILRLLTEIRCSASLGSGVRLHDGVFYIGRGMLERASLPYLASCILHDAFHVHQFQRGIDGYQNWRRRGKLTDRDQVQIERGAIEFQLKSARKLKLSKHEVEHLKRCHKKPDYFRVPHKKRTW